MSALGQERTLAVHLAMSALPPKADIRFRARPRVGLELGGAVDFFNTGHPPGAARTDLC